MQSLKKKKKGVGVVGWGWVMVTFMLHGITSPAIYSVDQALTQKHIQLSSFVIKPH